MADKETKKPTKNSFPTTEAEFLEAANALLKHQTICGTLAIAPQKLPDISSNDKCSIELQNKGYESGENIPDIHTAIGKQVEADLQLRQEAKKEYDAALGKKNGLDWLMSSLFSSSPSTDKKQLTRAYYDAIDEALRLSSKGINLKNPKLDHQLKCEPKDTGISNATSCKIEVPATPAPAASAPKQR